MAVKGILLSGGKTEYVQQQDLHLATTTVKEALRFSAVLTAASQHCTRRKDSLRRRSR